MKTLAWIVRHPLYAASWYLRGKPYSAALLLVCLLGGAVVALPACGAKGKHIATVADATALSATEAADDLETTAFRAGQVPLANHKAFSVELSKMYQAEIDIARLIKAVPAGGSIDLAQGLALLDKLKAAVTSALAALPASVSGPIANQLNKAAALAGTPLGK